MASEDLGGAVYRRREDVVRRCVAGEHILVPIRSNAADLSAVYALRGVGVHLWDQLEGSRTEDELVSSIVERYDVAADIARQDLPGFLADLVTRGLVERSDSR